MHMRVHIFEYTCMHICTCIQISLLSRANVRTYIHTCTRRFPTPWLTPLYRPHMLTHTYRTHVYTHTHTQIHKYLHTIYAHAPRKTLSFFSCFGFFVYRRLSKERNDWCTRLRTCCIYEYMRTYEQAGSACWFVCMYCSYVHMLVWTHTRMFVCTCVCKHICID